MSKFYYSIFYGGYDELAVSKERYNREQAIEIAKVELERSKKPYYIAIGDGYVQMKTENRVYVGGLNIPSIKEVVLVGCSMWRLIRMRLLQRVMSIFL